MIILTNTYRNATLIDLVSIKCRHVVRSVFVVEVVALANACNTAIPVNHELKRILKKTPYITVLIDSVTLFNVMIKNTPTTEQWAH